MFSIHRIFVYTQVLSWCSVYTGFLFIHKFYVDVQYTQDFCLYTSFIHSIHSFTQVDVQYTQDFCLYTSFMLMFSIHRIFVYTQVLSWCYTGFLFIHKFYVDVQYTQDFCLYTSFKLMFSIHRIFVYTQVLYVQYTQDFCYTQVLSWCSVYTGFLFIHKFYMFSIHSFCYTQFYVDVQYTQDFCLYTSFMLMFSIHRIFVIHKF